MVFGKSTKMLGARRTKQKVRSTEEQRQRFSPARSGKLGKNQLFHAISPYDELPEIQELAEKLTPRTPPIAQEVHHGPQERQHHLQTEKRSSDEMQQRDPPIASRPAAPDPFLNGAHDVPVVIEIPCIPTLSEDSGMTVDEIFRPKTGEDRGPRTLTPHPSFEDDVSPTASDLKYLFEAGVKADEEVWPSDEESVSKGGSDKEETPAWPGGSMYVWDLDCSNDNAIEFRCSDRRRMEV